MNTEPINGHDKPDNPMERLREIERVNNRIEADLERMDYTEVRLLALVPLVCLVAVALAAIVLALRIWL